MRKNILNMFIAVLLVGISSVSFAEDIGACFLHCFSCGLAIEKTCINNVTAQECQMILNVRNKEKTGVDKNGDLTVDPCAVLWRKDAKCHY